MHTPEQFRSTFPFPFLLPISPHPIRPRHRPHRPLHPIHAPILKIPNLLPLAPAPRAALLALHDVLPNGPQHLAPLQLPPERIRRGHDPRIVKVPKVLEVVQLLGAQQQRGGERVHAGVAPALVVEAALAVEEAEEVAVLLGAEEVEVADLEVGPEVAQVPQVAARVVQRERGPRPPQAPRHPRRAHEALPQVRRADALPSLELADGAEERRDRVVQLPQRDRVPVLLLLLAHHPERVVRDGAGKLDVRLDAPVPLVLLQRGHVVEFARVEAAHVVVGFELALVHAERAVGLDGGLALGRLHPEGVAEELGRQELEGHVAADDFADAVFEFLREGLVVHEDDGVVEPAVEVVFEGLQRGDGGVEVLVLS